MEINDLKEEIATLRKKGNELIKTLEVDKTGACKDFQFFVRNYEAWYTKSLLVVKQLMPDKLDDFIVLYRNEKRKNIALSNYTISDALRGLKIQPGNHGPETALFCVGRQINIVGTCLEAFESTIYNIQTILQADVFDSELDSARHLHKMGFIRAAGAICGVVLEKHFAGVAINHNIVIKKRDPHISDYNEAFKENVYDVVEWRKIQHLGDIRNLCDHKKDRDPTKEEVDELITGTERVIKCIH
ncbi:MAG: hypothetical protein EOM51_08670 [Clostridia bacterium]|nr:hypothetical protein [Clostridia bacterium]